MTTAERLIPEMGPTATGFGTAGCAEPLKRARRGRARRCVCNRPTVSLSYLFFVLPLVTYGIILSCHLSSYLTSLQRETQQFDEVAARLRRAQEEDRCENAARLRREEGQEKEDDEGKKASDDDDGGEADGSARKRKAALPSKGVTGVSPSPHYGAALSGATARLSPPQGSELPPLPEGECPPPHTHTHKHTHKHINTHLVFAPPFVLTFTSLFADAPFFTHRNLHRWVYFVFRAERVGAGLAHLMEHADVLKASLNQLGLFDDEACKATCGAALNQVCYIV